MDIKIENYRVDGSKEFKIKKTPTDSDGLESKKDELIKILKKSLNCRMRFTLSTRKRF